MRSVLVSGPADDVTGVARALRRQGFDIFGLDLPPRLGTGATGARPVRPVDCYVQLPPTGELSRSGSPTRSLLRRVEAVSVVSPLLARDATVLMVADDWDRRRRGALQLMTEAALNDAGGRRSVVVLDEPISAATLVAAAGRREANRPPLSLAAVSPDLPYADWRNEIFSLTTRDDSLVREFIDSSSWAADVTDAFSEIVSSLR